MNRADRTSGAWKNLKQRLGFKGIGCLGIKWPSPTQITILHENQDQPIRSQDQRGMNLASALEAERNLRGEDAPAVPTVKSLLMLIEETDGDDWKHKMMKKKIKSDVAMADRGGNDWVCCVCMEGSKGAAFIPCGHAFCRVCSRELWLNRGSCPVCNRSIHEILDIF